MLQLARYSSGTVPRFIYFGQSRAVVGTEIASLEEGMAWCRQANGLGNPFHYRLSGFELQAVK